MDQPIIPFALPDIGQAEISAVAEAMRSGWVSSGPRVEEFEADLSEFVGPGVQGLALSSATAGLHLALEALGIGPGDEVIVPTWTFTATAEVVHYLGAQPVFVDIDPVTLNLDLDRASERVNKKTRAVIPVHFAGNPMDATLLSDWSTAHNVPVIEDAAHAFSAASQGVRVGASTSRATVLSFYATKTITTGEGGMLLTHDTGLADRIRVMRLHGIDRSAFRRYRSSVPAWNYDVVAPGYKYNMTDTAAAMGLVQLRRAEEMRARRQQIAEVYHREFTDLSFDLPDLGRSGDINAWHLFVLRLGSSQARLRDRFIAWLFDEGISTSVHFTPLHRLSYWRDTYGLQARDFPVAESIFPRVVSLPLYSALTDSQVDRIVSGVRRWSG